jgi:phage-related protein
LFTEHSTTKQEKLNILKRFDSVSTMNEAKNLFNTIKSELGTKTTVTETVADKITNTPTTSTSQEVLSEAKAYENPQFKRMKDLMSKIK